MGERYWGIAEDINWSIGDHAKLRSLTAYRDLYFSFAIDSDATELNIINSYLVEDEHQFSQELDLNLHYDRFELVSGAYLFRDEDRTGAYVFIVPQSIVVAIRPYYAHSSPAAVFTQGTFHITPEIGIHGRNSVHGRVEGRAPKIETDYPISVGAGDSRDGAKSTS